MIKCDRIEINLESTDRNLTWYTIEQSVIEEGRFIKQFSGSNRFAIITLKIEPHF